MRTQRSRELTDLFAASMTGRLSRREIMRRGAGLGLSAPVIAMLLANSQRRALAQDATPAAGQEPGYSIVVPEGLRTDLSGQTLNYVTGTASAPDRSFKEAAFAKFAEVTGITVTYVPGEESATDRLAIYNQQLGAQSSDNDVYEIDVIWPGIMAQHAVNLNDALSEQASQHFEALVQNNTVDGNLVGMPFYTDAGLLYHRTDLLEKYGFENPPATWAELEEQAATIQEGERAANPDFQGFVFQGKAYEGLTCNALEWQVSNGGGTIIDQDGTVTVNNPQVVAAFERAAGWVGNISPEDVTTYQEPESLNVFAPGNAAFLRNWPYVWAVTQNEAEGSPLVGKVGISPLPKGDGPDARNAATLGGWQLMVSRYSEKQEAAVEFVKFMCSPEIQKARAIEGSYLPTIAAVYDDPDIAAASEFIPRLKDIFVGGAVVRPSTPSSDLYNSVSIAYHQRVNQILTGQEEAQAAVEEIESELNDIMSEL